MTTQTSLRRHDEQPLERTRERPTVAPAVDIYENADHILLVADLPGVTSDHVSIDLEKGELTLSAQRPTSQSGTAHSVEFGARDYYRRFLVPRGIDAEKISAELKQGVLRVTLPKSAALKPRKIEVKPS